MQQSWSAYQTQCGIKNNIKVFDLVIHIRREEIELIDNDYFHYFV